MSVSQMSVGQMHVGLMSVGQMHVGQMSADQMSGGQMSVDQMLNVFLTFSDDSAKCLLAKCFSVKRQGSI